MTKQASEYLTLSRTGERLGVEYARQEGLEVYSHVAGIPSLCEEIVRLTIVHSQDFEPLLTERLLSPTTVRHLRRNNYLIPEEYIHPSELAQQLTDRALIAVNMIDASGDESGMEFELKEPFKDVEVLAEFYKGFLEFFPQAVNN